MNPANASSAPEHPTRPRIEVGYHVASQVPGGFDWPALERESLRLHARYTSEVVEALGLCPWAESARTSGQVLTRVSALARPNTAEVVDSLGVLAEDATVQVGFLLFPLLDMDRLTFAHFVADVRAADAALRGAGNSVFALADFHPTASAETASAERLVPFLRRTPDLTIQLVRHSALREVRLSSDRGTSFIDPKQLVHGWESLPPAAPAPLAERVAKNNMRTVQRMGTEALALRFANILADRHASYFQLGLPLPLWKAHT